MSVKHLAAAALLVAAPLAHAGTVYIVNNCDHQVFITPSCLGTDKPTETKDAGETYSAPIEGAAVSLKIMTTNGFCTDNCVQLEYTREASDLWYDLSNINAKGMNGFVEGGLSVFTSDADAPKVDCPPGKGQCTKGVYNEWWQNEATFCSKKPESDLTMHLCGNGGSSSTPVVNKPVVVAPKKEEPKKEESKPAPVVKPAPAPARKLQEEPPKTTLAPVYTPPAKAEEHPNAHPVNLIGENDDGSLDLKADVVWVTDVVTVATTVFAKRSLETAAAEPIARRHIHRHAHAHNHGA